MPSTSCAHDHLLRRQLGRPASRHHRAASPSSPRRAVRGRPHAPRRRRPPRGRRRRPPRAVPERLRLAGVSPPRSARSRRPLARSRPRQAPRAPQRPVRCAKRLDHGVAPAATIRRAAQRQVPVPRERLVQLDEAQETPWSYRPGHEARRGPSQANVSARPPLDAIAGPEPTTSANNLPLVSRTVLVDPVPEPAEQQEQARARTSASRRRRCATASVAIAGPQKQCPRSGRRSSRRSRTRCRGSAGQRPARGPAPA